LSAAEEARVLSHQECEETRVNMERMDWDHKHDIVNLMGESKAF